MNVGASKVFVIACKVVAIYLKIMVVSQIGLKILYLISYPGNCNVTLLPVLLFFLCNVVITGELQ